MYIVLVLLLNARPELQSMVVLPDPFRDRARGDPTVGHAPKPGTLDGVSERLGCEAIQKVESAIIDDRRPCKKNSPVLSCIRKRIKESSNHGSEIWTFYNGEGPVCLRESGQREYCEKDFVSR